MVLLLLGSIATAHAQGGLREKSQTPQPSPTTAAPTPVVPTPGPQPWPRLEPGAVLCKSRDDLVAYQTHAAVGEHGSGCSRISKQVGIQILDRDGPSRTQIVTNDESKQTGWTNAYLPSSPPVAR